jgi:hypothetical protein
MYLETVSLDLAKKLKEVGFDLPTISYYHPRYNLYHDQRSYEDAFKSPEDFIHYNSSEWANCYYSAPTLELAKQWFREEHEKSINIHAEYYRDGMNWLWQIMWVLPENEWEEHNITDGTGTYGDNHEYPTYEEALEAALLKACELIKTKTI